MRSSLATVSELRLRPRPSRAQNNTTVACRRRRRLNQRSSGRQNTYGALGSIAPLNRSNQRVPLNKPMRANSSPSAASS